MEVVDIYKHLRRYRFINLTSEKELQVEIHKALQEICRDDLNREYRLSQKDIVDFFVPSLGLVIEIKVKGSAKAIYRQLERYAKHEQVKVILLLTAKTMGLPEKINDRPSYFMSLGQAWL